MSVDELIRLLEPYRGYRVRIVVPEGGVGEDGTFWPAVVEAVDGYSVAIEGD
jgi:hypothetical protein